MFLNRSKNTTDFPERIKRYCVRFAHFLLFRKAISSLPKSILVLRMGGIGDLICALPAFESLRNRFPESRVTLLTAGPVVGNRPAPGSPADFLLTTGFIDHIVIAPRKLSLAEIRQLRERIRKLSPELSVVLAYTSEGASGIFRKVVLLWLAGIRRGVPQIYIPPPFRLGGKTTKHLHQVETALRSIDAAPQSDELPLIEWPKAAASVQDLWRQSGLSAHRVIAFAPGAKFEHKRWPIQNFVQLCSKLVQQLGPAIRFVVIGGPDEAELAQKLVRSNPQAIVSLAGVLSLTETVEALRRCDLYIGNDSGPAHLSALARTPSVVLFASHLYPGIWEPWTKRRIVLRTDPECRYCLSELFCPLATNACIQAIPLDDVVRAACSMLRDQANTPVPSPIQQ